LVELTHRHSLIYAYEADLINPLVRGRSRNTFFPHEYALATIAMRCLEGANAFFEAFLTIPPSEYPLLSLNQWIGFTYATVMLYKLCLAVVRVPAWDVDLARSMVPFESYMEQSIRNMKVALRMTGHDHGPIQGHDLYSMHLPIWEDTLAAYLRKKGSPIEQRLTSSSGEVHKKTLEYSRKSGVSPRTTFSHPCPAYALWK
jgi:hypothetical protein